jgi:hypothetical protein
VVWEAVLLGRVVVEMHRCWDVLGLVGSIDFKIHLYVCNIDTVMLQF